jgi:hypothetical protein
MWTENKTSDHLSIGDSSAAAIVPHPARNAAASHQRMPCANHCIAAQVDRDRCDDDDGEKRIEVPVGHDAVAVLPVARRHEG